MAEERNQIDLKDEGEYEDEEARYGAVDRRGKVVVYGSKATGAKAQRFTNFHPTIDRDGLEKMTNGFLQNVSKKSPTDFFAVPNQNVNFSKQSNMNQP